MAATISVNKKTVEDFLKSAQKQKFLIPEYQRPYTWDFDKIKTLFDDLVAFTEKRSNEKSQENYFLGTTVYFVNKDEQQEIIDGQQRITSLLLLLRVIYKKLSDSHIRTDEGENFIREIEPLIWQKGELDGKADKNTILISSKVVTDKQNSVLYEILKTGKVEENARDNYSKNYRHFLEFYDDFIKNNSDPKAIYIFINNLLNYTIILPIEADTQDTALTIFSTLNDRGQLLTDADIFKAQIYGSLSSDKKDDFIKKWQDIEDEANEIDESMQSLFYIYMFYLRASDNDKKVSTPKLRTYFAKNKFSRLKDDNLIDNLKNILNLLHFVKSFDEIENESWTKNEKIKQLLDMFRVIDNEWWKYPVAIYYLTYKDIPDFDEYYAKFLKKLFVSFFQKYSVDHSVSSLKYPILVLNSEIMKNKEPIVDLRKISISDDKEFENRIQMPHKNLRAAILLFLAYLNDEQVSVLPQGWEIEHIFPKKYQASIYIDKLDWTKEKLDNIMWNIGNLTPLEKKLNIKASNGYFERKKEEYEKSKIAISRKIANDYSDFLPDDIIKRNDRIVQLIKDKFNEWLSN